MSSAPALELVAATKQWRRRGRQHRALDGASFTVEGPGVHALVGPNGAGKTTALRAALGLVQLTSGSCRLHGLPAGPRARAALRRTGALIETPRFPAAMDAITIMRIHADLLGCRDDAAGRALERVGLAGRAHDRVGRYSLGMRQRLGIAVALVSEPDLLLLDEPSNGLDPPGIRELRSLLRSLADGGTAILVSSHLLSEIEQVADTVTVLAAGRTIHTGPLAALQRSRTTLVRATSPAALDALRRGGWTVTVDDDGALHVADRGAPPGSIATCLAAAGIALTELRPDRHSLDDAFDALLQGVDGAAGEVGRLR